MATIVRLAGVDVSAHVLPRSLSWGPRSLHDRIDQAKFILRESTPVVPDDDMYVEVTDPAGEDLVFAGLARQPDARESVEEAGQEVVYPVACQGWAALMDRIPITQRHIWPAGTSDAFMVRELLDTYGDQLGTGLEHVAVAARHDMPQVIIDAGSLSLRRGIDDIAAIANGAPWLVEPGKRVRYNDLRTLAGFALTDAPDPGETVVRVRSLRREGSSTRSAHRVRVVGTGLDYTATDWSEWNRANQHLGEEPGLPQPRTLQLPDVVDLRILTQAGARRRAWSILHNQRRRRGYVARLYERDLPAGTRPEPGQLVDVASAKIASGVRGQLGFAHSPVMPTRPRLPKGLGRFLIQRVRPSLITGRDEWQYDLEFGAHARMLQTELTKVGAPQSLTQEMFRDGELRSDQLTTVRSSANIPQVTTTAVGSFVFITQLHVRLVRTGSVIVTIVATQAKHSAAAAVFDFYLTIQRQDEVFIDYAAITDIKMPASGDSWMPITMTGEFRPSDFGFDPGLHFLSLWTINRTTGTLTIGRDNTFDFWTFLMFGEAI